VHWLEDEALVPFYERAGFKSSGYSIFARIFGILFRCCSMGLDARGRHDLEHVRETVGLHERSGFGRARETVTTHDDIHTLKV
jgi:hypothetical protein